jgi:hypothetical protein
LLTAQIKRILLKTLRMNYAQMVHWLLAGDVAIQYQIHRDLFGVNRTDLQARIPTEGWGNNSWINSGPMVTGEIASTTQMDLYSLHLAGSENAGMPQDLPMVKGVLTEILQHNKSADGGINPHTGIGDSDVCINGMFLSYGCYFGVPAQDLESVIDFSLSQKMPDGGFNCRSNRSGAVHSSVHTTLSMLEGFWEYERQGYQYRLGELQAARKNCLEFLLMHRLFRSDHTGRSSTGTSCG